MGCCMGPDTRACRHATSAVDGLWRAAPAITRLRVPVVYRNSSARSVSGFAVPREKPAVPQDPGSGARARRPLRRRPHEGSPADPRPRPPLDPRLPPHGDLHLHPRPRRRYRLGILCSPPIQTRRPCTAACRPPRRADMGMLDTPRKRRALLPRPLPRLHHRPHPLDLAQRPRRTRRAPKAQQKPPSARAWIPSMPSDSPISPRPSPPPRTLLAWKHGLVQSERVG